MEKLEKVIAGLSECLRSTPKYCFDCPYQDAEFCHDELFTDALEVIEDLRTDNRRLRDMWAAATKKLSVARAERDLAREKLSRITGEREAAWLEEVSDA